MAADQLFGAGIRSFWRGALPAVLGSGVCATECKRHGTPESQGWGTGVDVRPAGPSPCSGSLLPGQTPCYRCPQCPWLGSFPSHF